MRLWIAIKAFFQALREPAAQPEQPSNDPGHLRMLSLLQQGGRLIDFLKEDISTYSDAQVGAAVRKIHSDCSQCIEELVAIRPLLTECEGSMIKVSAGYNPEEIKIVGKVKGEPPFNGVLVHRGWKACKRSLPKQIGGKTGEVLCPAEIEVH